MNLITDILKLAEMQYRKGFEAGYVTAGKGLYSLEKVKNWRFRGFKSGFNDNTCLNGATFENPKGALVAELKNCKLFDLADLLTAKERKNQIIISEITETFDGLQINVSGIENLSDDDIKRKIIEAFRY
jgi:hypothetical protein